MGRILQGDVLEQLATLPDESVQCCVTSPPYWGLRDYGVEGQIGLEPTIEEYVAKMVEVFREVRQVLRKDGTLWLNMGDSYNSAGPSNHGKSDVVHRGTNDEDWSQPSKIIDTMLKPKDMCGIPWRVALALQADGWWLRSDIIWSKPNPMPGSQQDRPTSAHEYIFLFAKGEWKSRIVKFANLDGEYFHFLENFGLGMPVSSHSGSPYGINHSPLVEICVRLAATVFYGSQSEKNVSLPPFYSEEWKQGLDGTDSDFVRGLPVPHRPTIIAARFLRSDSTAKEFLSELNRLGITLTKGNNFLIGGVPTEFSHSPPIYRDGETAIAIHHTGKVCKVDFVNHTVETSYPSKGSYYYDAEAVRVPMSQVSLDRINQPTFYSQHGGGKDYGKGVNPNMSARKALENIARKGRRRTPAGWTVNHDESDLKGRYPQKKQDNTGNPTYTGFNDRYEPQLKANLRDVWTIATQPYPLAHFATFPERIPQLAIMAGTSAKGVCPECGAPWERVVEKELVPQQDVSGERGKRDAAGNKSMDHRQDGDLPRGSIAAETTGWSPTCDHVGEPIPATVLDPFGGRGTVGKVAIELGREWIIIELNPDYIPLIEESTKVTMALGLVE